MNKQPDALKKHGEMLRNGEVQPKPMLDPIQKAKQNPRSLRLAINAKCYDCTCFQKTEVKHCEMTNCPLWAVRPWQ